MKRSWLPSAAIRNEAMPPDASTSGSMWVASSPRTEREPEQARIETSPISLAWRNVSSQGMSLPNGGHR